MKAAIAIDAWKLPIFERHLKQNGYDYEQGLGITEDTMFLYVHTEHPEGLANVVMDANIEAARTGAPQ